MLIPSSEGEFGGSGKPNQLPLGDELVAGPGPGMGCVGGLLLSVGGALLNSTERPVRGLATVRVAQGGSVAWSPGLPATSVAFVAETRISQVYTKSSPLFVLTCLSIA